MSNGKDLPCLYSSLFPPMMTADKVEVVLRKKDDLTADIQMKLVLEVTTSEGDKD